MPYITEEANLTEVERFFLSISLPTCLVAPQQFTKVINEHEMMITSAYVFDCGLTFREEKVNPGFEYNKQISCPDPEPDYWTIDYKSTRFNIISTNCSHDIPIFL